MAIPKLLDLLVIEVAVITIDAMGHQRGITRNVINKEAGYVLALGGDQGALQHDVECFVAEQNACGLADTIISQDTTAEGDHDRVE